MGNVFNLKQTATIIDLSVPVSSYFFELDPVIQETVGNTRFDEETLLEELGIDSIEKSELSVKLQKALCMKFNFQQFQTLISIGQIYQYVLFMEQEKFA